MPSPAAAGGSPRTAGPAGRCRPSVTFSPSRSVFVVTDHVGPIVTGGTRTSLILGTGGTGSLGKLVVPRLRETGAKVRVLSRQARDSGDVEFVRGDLDTG